MQKHLLYIVLGCAGLIFLCVIGGLLFFGEPMLAALVFAVGLVGIGAFGIYNWYRRQNLVAEADASVETQPEASDSIAKTPPSQGQAKPAEAVPSPAAITSEVAKPAPQVIPPPLLVLQVTPPPSKITPSPLSASQWGREIPVTSRQTIPSYPNYEAQISIQCEICGHHFPGGHGVVCDNCGEEYCSDCGSDFAFCASCYNVFCQSCEQELTECEICGDKFCIECESDLFTCTFCERSFCKNCEDKLVNLVGGRKLCLECASTLSRCE